MHLLSTTYWYTYNNQYISSHDQLIDLDQGPEKSSLIQSSFTVSIPVYKLEMF